MKETPEAYLRRMFESDRNAADYWERNTPYKIQTEVGASLGWPSISEVWRAQGEPPPWESRGEFVERWAQCWALLQKLHAQYLEQSGK